MWPTWITSKQPLARVTAWPSRRQRSASSRTRSRATTFVDTCSLIRQHDLSQLVVPLSRGPALQHHDAAGIIRQPRRITGISACSERGGGGGDDGVTRAGHIDHLIAAGDRDLLRLGATVEADHAVFAAGD